MSTSAPSAIFGRRYEISASHRLHTDLLNDEANRAAYGKCNNPHGHGHNYTIEVQVEGPVEAETGMVINLVDLDRIVSERVLSRFDHVNLNLDPLFVNRVPTTENLSRAVHELLSGAFDPAKLALVRVEETENNFFEYDGN